jgi:alpha-ketoglutarate-dependent taurine dioxygenase
MSNISVREVSPVFGVEVSGLEPRTPLDAETLRELRGLFDKYGLVLIRDLDIDLNFQTYLSWNLIGREMPSDPAAAAPRGDRGGYYVSNREPDSGAPFGRLLYHSDAMWRDDASELLSLYGVEVEEPSTPTMFVSAAHGWRTLPADLRARVEERSAEHGHDATYNDRGGGDGEVLVAKFDSDERVRLPIGHRHPRTGETLLYVCQQFTLGVADMAKADSEALLEELFRHLYKPENTYAHQWRKGDLVLWDNLALQHARPNVKVEGPARTLRKTMAPISNMKSPPPRLSLLAG